jgi:hypothetical protein
VCEGQRERIEHAKKKVTEQAALVSEAVEKYRYLDHPALVEKLGLQVNITHELRASNQPRTCPLVAAS